MGSPTLSSRAVAASCRLAAPWAGLETALMGLELQLTSPERLVPSLVSD